MRSGSSDDKTDEMEEKYMLFNWHSFKFRWSHRSLLSFENNEGQHGDIMTIF